MLAHGRFLAVAVVCWVLVLPTAGTLAAAPPQGPNAASEDQTPGKAVAGPSDRLSLLQQQIADRFRHLEKVLLRMAELTEATDARRSALLKKAVSQSGDRLINVQFERLVELLRNDQIARALENQGNLNQDLRALLELLLSEDRVKRIEAERARIRRYLKQLNRIIKQQKDVQGRTEGGADPDGLAKEQQRLAENTGELAKEIKKHEENGDGKPTDGEGKTPEDQGKRPDDQNKQEDGKGKDGNEKEDQKEPKEGQQGKAGQQQPGQKQPGADGEGKQQEQQQEQQPQEQDDAPNPARKRLEAARQKMKEAQEKLEKAQREGAVEDQEEAIRELEQAKAELEEILRQLREEEIERMLAMLEARFRKMLELQRDVYEGTLRLDKIPQAQRTHNHEIEAGRLSEKETQIVILCDKALLVLREDGTAVAFPEAVEQMQEDMQQVVQRLARSMVDQMTQGIEEDIIAALEEMVEALKKAQEDMAAKKQQQQQQPQQQQQQDPALVDLLAELKMIRALQMRVNRRTDRYAKMIEGEQAEAGELIEALQRLAEREERISRVTRDLALGKNR